MRLGVPSGGQWSVIQRGILSEKDTDGVALEWGNAELALELIRKISMREGFGNILRRGLC